MIELTSFLFFSSSLNCDTFIRLLLNTELYDYLSNLLDSFLIKNSKWFDYWAMYFTLYIIKIRSKLSFYFFMLNEYIFKYFPFSIEKVIRLNIFSYNIRYTIWSLYDDGYLSIITCLAANYFFLTRVQYNFYILNNHDTHLVVDAWTTVAHIIERANFII